jgi:hypothetical protein
MAHQLWGDENECRRQWLRAHRAQRFVPNRHQSFHSFVTQSVFGEALFQSGQLDGDSIVLIKMATNKPPLILRKRLSCLAKSGRACCIACQHRAESGSRAAPNERGSSVGPSAIQAGCAQRYVAASPRSRWRSAARSRQRACLNLRTSRTFRIGALSAGIGSPLAWPKRGPRPRFDRRHRELQAELMAADWLQKLGLEHCLPLAKSFG